MGKLCNLFSTELWQFNNDDMDQFHPNMRASFVNNEDLKQMILEKEKTEVSETLSNSGGWHSGAALQNDKRFSALWDFIALGMKQIISYNNYRDVDIVISNAWANVNRYRDFNEIHQHPGVHWSGVYYVDVPENSGAIRFFDPRVVRQMTMPYELYSENLESIPYSQCLQITLDPHTGSMLIFPSWLQHAVHPNETKEPRISISFNIILIPHN